MLLWLSCQSGHTVISVEVEPWKCCDGLALVLDDSPSHCGMIMVIYYTKDIGSRTACVLFVIGTALNKLYVAASNKSIRNYTAQSTTQHFSDFVCCSITTAYAPLAKTAVAQHQGVTSTTPRSHQHNSTRMSMCTVNVYAASDTPAESVGVA